MSDVPLRRSARIRNAPSVSIFYNEESTSQEVISDYDSLNCHNQSSICSESDNDNIPPASHEKIISEREPDLYSPQTQSKPRRFETVDSDFSEVDSTQNSSLLIPQHSTNLHNTTLSRSRSSQSQSLTNKHSRGKRYSQQSASQILITSIDVIELSSDSDYEEKWHPKAKKSKQTSSSLSLLSKKKQQQQLQQQKAQEEADEALIEQLRSPNAAITPLSTYNTQLASKLTQIKPPAKLTKNFSKARIMVSSGTKNTVSGDLFAEFNEPPPKDDDLVLLNPSDHINPLTHNRSFDDMINQYPNIQEPPKPQREISENDKLRKFQSWDGVDTFPDDPTDPRCFVVCYAIYHKPELIKREPLAPRVPAFYDERIAACDSSNLLLPTMMGGDFTQEKSTSHQLCSIYSSFNQQFQNDDEINPFLIDSQHIGLISQQSPIQKAQLTLTPEIKMSKAIDFSQTPKIMGFEYLTNPHITTATVFDEVMDLVTQSQIPPPHNTKISSTTPQTNLDDDIVLVHHCLTAFHPLIHFPHPRKDCKTCVGLDPLLYCANCCCFTCDTPIIRCGDWKTHGSTKSDYTYQTNTKSRKEFMNMYHFLFNRSLLPSQKAQKAAITGIDAFPPGKGAVCLSGGQTNSTRANVAIIEEYERTKEDNAFIIYSTAHPDTVKGYTNKEGAKTLLAFFK